MKLQITFPNSFHVFCRIRNTEQKILEIEAGSYVVDRVDGHPTFYLFTHPTFFFQVEKKTWDSGEFVKTFNIKVSKVKQ